MLSEQEIEARNKCDRFMCRGGAYYGYYVDAPAYNHAIITDDNIIEDICLKTLSQCTGVKDSNGVIIFENDICMVGDRIGVVEWSEGDWHVYLFKVKRHDNWFKFSVVYEEGEKIKIIGDKFSNPESLETSNG